MCIRDRKEVDFRVEKKVENEIVTGEKGIRHEKFLACISSNERTPRHIILSLIHIYMDDCYKNWTTPMEAANLLELFMTQDS